MESTFSNPFYYEYEEYQNRLKKLHEIQALGMEPYPHKYEPSSTLGAIQTKYKDKEVGHSDDAAAGDTESFKLAGRLVLFRPMGKNAFGHIQDETGRMQLMFNREQTHVIGYDPEKVTPPQSAIKFIEKKIDLGDIIGVEGNLFRTQTGELTLFVKKLTLLTKSLLPLPDKHSGLADKGTRYRKRWLDLISNEGVVNTFALRSKIIKIIRSYLEGLDFMEVETPILQNTYGGAEARPFTSELNALHQEMFLRISLEISLKKLIVGGFLRVFEIGKVFRNEGIDKTHNPEFTLLEAYGAYWDYNDVMKVMEELMEKIAITLFGTTKIVYPQDGGKEEIVLDVKAPWIRMSMKQAIKTYGKIDVDSLSDDQLRKLLKETGELDPQELEKATRGTLIAGAFEAFAEKHLIQPHHIIDHPIETTPLCKLHRDPKLKKERFVERFESFILGRELCNAYSELNDPVLQRELLVEQAKKNAAGDEEASPLDEDFLEAICQGMPPTGGLGFGVDRLVMIFAKALSIRDVIFFPLMKPDE